MPDDAPGVAFHQHFRRAGARVVIRTQHETIGAGGTDRQEIAGHGVGHGAVARQEIAGFADRSHHIHDDGRQRVLAQRHDFVMRAIERRADEIVHAGVNHQEFLLAVALAVKDAGEQHAGGTHDAAAGFDHDGEAAGVDSAQEALHEGADLGRFLSRVVAHAEAPAQIEVADGVPRGAQFPGQRQHLVQGFENRAGVQDLRPDVATHAFGHQVAELPRVIVDGGRAGDGDAELVLAQAGGYVGMGDSVHVGVDADGKAGCFAETRRLGVEQRQLRLRFAVEGADAALQRVFHFRGGLADSGEDDLRGVAAGFQDAVEFAAGDDVETGALFGQERQHGQRRIGFHRVANGVRQGSERGGVSRIVLADGLAGIDVGRRSNAVREVGQRDLLTVIVVLRIGEHFQALLG